MWEPGLRSRPQPGLPGEPTREGQHGSHLGMQKWAERRWRPPTNPGYRVLEGGLPDFVHLSVRRPAEPVSLQVVRTKRRRRRQRLQDHLLPNARAGTRVPLERRLPRPRRLRSGVLIAGGKRGLAGGASTWKGIILRVVFDAADGVASRRAADDDRIASDLGRPNSRHRGVEARLLSPLVPDARARRLGPSRIGLRSDEGLLPCLISRHLRERAWGRVVVRGGTGYRDREGWGSGV